MNALAQVPILRFCFKFASEPVVIHRVRSALELNDDQPLGLASYIEEDSVKSLLAQAGFPTKITFRCAAGDPFALPDAGATSALYGQRIRKELVITLLEECDNILRSYYAQLREGAAPPNGSGCQPPPRQV